MFGRMKQEALRGGQAKGGVCQKSSRSEVERESHSLKCTNSGASSEKPRFLNQKISLISSEKHPSISISGFGL